MYENQAEIVNDNAILHSNEHKTHTRTLLAIVTQRLLLIVRIVYALCSTMLHNFQ